MSMMFWICPECNISIHEDNLRCNCGYVASRSEVGINKMPLSEVASIVAKRKEEKTLLEKESFGKFSTHEEYEAWKAHKIKNNKTNSPNFVLCPHCDEKIQEGVDKCPYCAERIVSPIISEKEHKEEDEGEQSLQRLSAVTKKPSAAQQQNKEEAEDNRTLELKNKIKKIDKLLSAGIISEEEFKLKREQLIDEYVDE